MRNYTYQWFSFHGSFGNNNSYLRFQYTICFALILVSELFERESYLLRIVALCRAVGRVSRTLALHDQSSITGLL